MEKFLQIVKERGKMENNISGQIRRILDREMELLSLEKHEYRKLRHLGSLIIRRRQYGIIFTEKNNGREKGITSDKARITLLGRKRYLKKSIPRREKVCKTLQAAITEIENVESPPLDFPWDIKELKKRPVFTKSIPVALRRNPDQPNGSGNVEICHRLRYQGKIKIGEDNRRHAHEPGSTV